MTTFVRARVAKRLTALTATVLLAVGIAGAVSAQAGTTLTSLTSESFTNASTVSTGWSVPSRTTNGACLTAGSDTAQRPIAGCSPSVNDSAGSGTLRLTTNVNNAVGTVYNTTSLPTTKGLDVRFNTYQYNSTSNPGADGIAFILAATDPTNPAPPAVRGPLGGSLGYSAAGSTAGVSYGYLGFGVDVFGNYRNSNFGGSGCSSSTAAAQNITVRGPGNGTAGYCIAGTQQVSAGALDARTATARPAAVPVEIAVNPSGGDATAQGGFTVPARSWAMQVTPLGGSAQTLTGALPSANDLNTLGFPSSYIDPDTGLPYQLTFGWAASTGGNNEIHEVNTLASQTLTGKLPVYRLDVGDNEGGTLLAGNQAVVAVTPSLDAAEGGEAKAPTVTTTFPASLTPASSFTTTGYTCSTSGQVVTCTYTGALPVAAGDAFPAVRIPVTIASNAAGSYTVTGKVSSTDGNPAVANRTVTVTPLAATSTPNVLTHGASSTLAVTGMPASATGTVRFTSGGSTLCTATLPATSCSTPPTTNAGSYSVVATYSGDSAFAAQTATTAFVVNKATVTVTADATPASVSYGSGSTLAMRGLPADATGTITFTANSATLCSATLPDPTCLTSSTLGVGNYNVTARYNGDVNYDAKSAATTLTVAKATPPFAAAPASSSVAYGTAQTLSGSGLPADATGSVVYTSGGTTLCTQSVPSDTSCVTSATLPTGTYPVVASYSGDARYNSVDRSFSYSVTKADTTIVAGVASATVTYGSADTLTASGLTVSGPAAATGKITFTSGGDTLCVATLPATSCSTSTSLGAGTYPVTASYSGDDNHAAATDTTSFRVTKKATGSGFTVASTPATVAYGTSAMLSHDGLPGGATGKVTFAHHGDTLCTATLPSTSCSTDRWTPTGSYDITATYSGDDNHETATATTDLDVTKAATTLTAGVAAPSVTYGTTQTVLSGGFDGHATGTVTFTTGSKTLCTATLPDTSCTATGMDAATYPVTATYSGDDNHDTAVATTTYTVTPRNTALTVSASPTSTPYPGAPGLALGGLPAGATGEVTFRSGTRLLCTVTLPATGCALTDELPAGAYPVTATYSGDTNNNSSTANTSFTVAKAAVDIVMPVPPRSVDAGSPTTMSVTGLPASATGTVTYAAAGTVLCVATLPTTSCVTTSLVAGNYEVTATYSGDDNHLPATTTRSYVVAAIVSTTATSGQPRTVTPPGADTAKKMTITGPPERGDARLVGGKLIYTPPADFTGTATVTVTVTDADGTTQVLTYRFDVDAAPPAPPVAPAVPGSAAPATGTVTPIVTKGEAGTRGEDATADTGAPVAQLVGAAFALLAAGAALTLGARRRRTG